MRLHLASMHERGFPHWLETSSHAEKAHLAKNYGWVASLY